ncbi:peptidase M16 [Aquaspirillum sp. LM1]|uniref:M16 family metallopeptidase n=1 Tax=Aquaspirillum sp. LM1 TaxID=1938604 RepID=UPI000983FF09|nr:pitrilysin family protein [Aquaspirillum sp. LM1]AQR63783.1 peptidase M16 [Aquaspirillum sp. LM1]
MSQTTPRWGVLGLLAGLWLSLPALADEPVETTLRNGLKVVVKVDRRAPVAVSQIWYRVGSVDEASGITGVSHALEHMMFKGTAQVPAGEFSRRIAALGGKENAFTSKDYTVYFQQLANHTLPQAMALEADRMTGLRIDDAAFASEISVIREERRQRTDDQPTGVLFEQLFATALTANPARQPIIGWMGDLERMRADDLRQWYQRWYAPNNAILVVVGDVDPQQVFKLAEQHYGPLPARSLPARSVLPEPSQYGERRLTIKRPSQLGYVALAWQAPRLSKINDSEPYALDMLAAVLDGHAASRLPRALVREQQVASSVSAGYDMTGRGASLFTLIAVPAAGKTAAQAEAALKQQIARLVKEGVTEAELARVRTQLKAARVYEKDSMFGQAMKIGQLEALGFSWRDDDAIDRQLDEVTPAAVQAVAKRYLTDDRLTAAVLLPQAVPAGQVAAPTLNGGAHVR